MTRICPFDLNVHSEELFSVSEAEYDEVMSTSAVDDNWQGYGEWSADVDANQQTEQAALAPSTLYVDPKDGKVKQIPEPKSLGRIGGIEL